MAIENQAQGTADFDWEALANDGYTNVERSELSDTYEATLTSIAEKEVVEGTIVALNKKKPL